MPSPWRLLEVRGQTGCVRLLPPGMIITVATNRFRIRSESMRIDEEGVSRIIIPSAFLILSGLRVMVCLKRLKNL
jgi:hypothetical protein